MTSGAAAPSQPRLGLLAADGLLLICAVIWGVTFVAQKMATDHMGPVLFTGLRFSLGALVLLPFAWRKWRALKDPSLRRACIIGGLLAGMAMSAGSMFQQVGMQDPSHEGAQSASVSSAGFITGLYVILVPMLGLLVGQRVRWMVWTGAILAVAGLFFLSIYKPAPGSWFEGVEMHMSSGDLWVLACAFAWAVHVQVVGWAAPKADPYVISVVQFAVTGAVALVIATVLAVFFGDQPWGAREAFDLKDVQAVIGPLLFAAVVSTGLAFTLQVVAQTSAPPAHAALLLSLESVFAAIAEAICLGIGWELEGCSPMTQWKLLGCGLMFAGVLVSQWRPKRATSAGTSS